MDNIYNSASFCKKAFNNKKKAMVLGVTRKGLQGIPSYVRLELVGNKVAQRHVQDTVKAAVLEGNKDCPNLVDCSAYDTKLVQFFPFHAQLWDGNWMTRRCSMWKRVLQRWCSSSVWTWSTITTRRWVLWILRINYVDFTILIASFGMENDSRALYFGRLASYWQTCSWCTLTTS